MKKLTVSLLIFTLFTGLLGPSWSALADSQMERRARAGIKLFRAMIAADLDIAEKADGKGTLRLLVVYDKDSGFAGELGDILEKAGKTGGASQIHDLPVKIDLSDALSLEKPLSRRPAGIFVAEPLTEETLRKLIEYSIDKKIILYSPFEGDVERGVLGGLSVEARVQPYVNMKTLERSGVRIKPFFMKVSKRYE